MFLLNGTNIRGSNLGATRNWCSLGASFGGSFSHRPWSSLRKAFARNSGWIKIVSGTEKCLYVVGYDVVILSSFSHTWLDRVSGFPIGSGMTMGFGSGSPIVVGDDGVSLSGKT